MHPSRPALCSQSCGLGGRVGKRADASPSGRQEPLPGGGDWERDARGADSTRQAPRVATRGQQSPYSPLSPGAVPRRGICRSYPDLIPPSSQSTDHLLTRSCGEALSTEAGPPVSALWVQLLALAVQGTHRRHWIPRRNPVGPCVCVEGGGGATQIFLVRGGSRVQEGVWGRHPAQGPGP